MIQVVLSLPEQPDVLIVDDNSPDGTGSKVNEIIQSNKKVNLISRSGKLGLGTAYIEGFKFALAEGYDYIIEMDCDFSHDPKDISRLLKEIDDYDLVIGSRYIQGVNVVNWPLKRLILSMGASFYTRVITGMPLKDATSGFKCFRKEVIQSIDLDKIHSNGYSFQIEMHYKTWKKKFRIKEMPIIFTDRIDGHSKMGKAIVREAIFMVWKLRFPFLIRNK
ncbi:TPA: dolichyl-phosphate beta-D-mannosyltransferase [Candidatus Delongbacteria bacterium]|nr:MAG: dolichyl-phosphate beta-D-mannosyltransferase [Candidatus Delongbacteria bacterium GWF2_40_14]HAQ62371.1 dolichyl-phosphate beta-D-mannosyltransferase [Candidatus Delongbacteria bacterium]